MKIAIVGAGLTGSLLANKLVDKGFEVTVCEKSRGAGGRCTHKRTAWGSFDMGAPVIPATDPAFQKFMQQQVANQQAKIWPAQSYQYSEGLVIPKTNQPSYIFLPTMHGTCKAMLLGSHIVTQFRVVDIRKQRNGWILIEQNGQASEAFDRVVICAPWPQTHALLSSIPDFDLPKQQQQQWTSCWTVALQFEKPLDTTYQYIYCKGSVLQTLVNDSAKPQHTQQHPIWVAYFDNAVSEQCANLEKSQITEMVLTEIKQILAIPLPAVLNSYLHYWRFARPKQQQKPLGIIGDLSNGLIAGGDWSEGASVQSSYITAQKLSALFE